MGGDIDLLHILSQIFNWGVISKIYSTLSLLSMGRPFGWEVSSL
jgi:hypothetical protein